MTTDTAPSLLLASFRASYRDLLRYLAQRTGSADEARDLAHDAWLRVADMAQQGREPALRTDGEARAYLFAMARNLVIDQRRRDGVAQRHADGQRGGSAFGPDAAEAAMYGQAVHAVEAALAGLPERAREVFLRNRIHGEDQAALAAAFGISRNMVERDMMLAMDRVQAAMEQWHAGAPTAPEVRRTGRRRSLAALLGLAGMAMGGIGGWRWWRMAVPGWQQAAQTGHGRTLRQPLPDGSVVTLDAQSRVQMAYYAGWRSVRLLEGAAFFEVAADAHRPFVVEVPGADGGLAPQPPLRVTVLGTRFGVERRGDGGVEVQVESGRVRVEAPARDGTAPLSRDLLPGEALRWQPPEEGAGGDGRFTAARLHAPRDAASWRNGVLAFDDAPLGSTVDRLRRYLPRAVEIDPAAAALRVSGQVRIAQAEDFLRALPGSLAVRVRLEQGRWQIRKI